MQRGFMWIGGVAAVALAVAVTWSGIRATAPVLAASASASADAGSDGGVDAGEASVGVDAGGLALAEPALAVAPLALPANDASAPLGSAGSGAVPASVRFGVVLVQYAGAEGAGAKARSRKEALAIAEQLQSDAKGDFHAAVQRGDSGSADDVGRVRHGDLEPALESVIFALPVGGVSDVVDTPRGYWIAKRVE